MRVTWIVDVIACFVLGVLALAGWSRGLVTAASSLCGFAIGMAGGGYLSRKVSGSSSVDPVIALWGLIAAITAAMVMAALLEYAGSPIRRRIHRSTVGEVADRLLGAAAGAALGAILVWGSAAVLMGVPVGYGVRPYIVSSHVVGQLNTAFPDPRPVLGFIARYDPLPMLRGPSVAQIAAPDAATAGTPGVQRSAASVVRIVGAACGYQVTGSGWVAMPGVVVTNAHVVAGGNSTAVQVDGRGRELPADVVAFDPDYDLAVLAVPGLSLPSLSFRTGFAAAGEAGSIAGYPENGPRDIQSVRVGTTGDVRTTDITGDRQVRRPVTAFRGVVRQGNSGGPLLDEDGRVLGAVFAGALDAPPGGYAIPAAAVVELLRKPQLGPVSTGSCVG